MGDSMAARKGFWDIRPALSVEKQREMKFAGGKIVFVASLLVVTYGTKQLRRKQP